MTNQDKKLVQHELKQNAKLSFPFIAAQMIYALSSFIGTAMIAKLGAQVLAASILVSMVWLTLSVLFFSLLNAVGILVSQKFGARDNQAINFYMGQAFILGVIISIIIILSLICVPLLLTLSHQSAVVLQLAKQYAYSLMWTTPALIYLIIIEEFLTGIGQSKLVLLISLIIVPLEIPLIHLLVFGGYGLTAFGIAGLGFAFALSYTLTAIALTFYLCLANAYKSYHIFSYISHIDMTALKAFLHIGLPLGFTEVIEVSSFALLTFWISHFGTTMLAAHQIVMQYLGFLLTLLFAMSQAVTVRMGHILGSKQEHKLIYAAFAGVILSLIMIIGIIFGLHIAKLSILQWDINIDDVRNTHLMADTLQLFAMVSLWLIMENFRVIGQGILRGLGDNSFSMLTSMMGFWLIGLPLAYYLGFYTYLGAVGLWWGLTLGIAIAAALVVYRVITRLQTYQVNAHIAPVSLFSSFEIT